MNKLLLILFTLLIISTNISSLFSKELPKGSLILGKKNAPITLYEYSSITCPHCANFHIKVLPIAKKKYIDKGLLCLILIPYPLDNLSIKITTILESVPITKKWSLLNSLYNNQPEWMSYRNEQDLIDKISHITGLKELFIKNSMNNKKLIKKIIKKRRNIAQSLKINTAPTFISGIRIWRYSITMVEINKVCENYFQKNKLISVS